MKSFDLNTVPWAAAVVGLPPMTCCIMALPLVPMAVIVAYAIWRGFYNLCCHPLRKFPGPMGAKVSDFYKLWLMSTKETHTRGLLYHEQYGPVVRAAPNLLAINDPQLLPKVYNRRADKTDIFTEAILGDLAPPMETRDWKEHSIRRRRVANTFFQTSLLQMEGQIDKTVHQFIQALSSRYADRPDTTANLAQWSQWFSYDAICNLTFGEPLGFIRDACDVADLIKTFHAMAPVAGFVFALPWVVAPVLTRPWLRKLLFPPPSDTTAKDKIESFIAEVTAKKAAEETESKKLNNIMSANKEDGEAIQTEDAGADSFVLLVLASDTTAAFICAFVKHVLQNPGIHARLVAELNDFDRRGKLSDPIPTWEEVLAMPYFVACHREIQRHQPSASILLSRLVGDQGLDLGNGMYAPPGTEIGANAYVINRDRAIFGDDADEFNPDRWLIDDEDRVREMDKFMLTWGYGARVCLGKNMALIETYKLLVQLFRKFHVSATEADQKRWRQENKGLFVHYDMHIRLRHREPVQRL